MDPFFRRGAPFLFGMLALAGSPQFLAPALALENLFEAPLRPHGPSLHRVLFSSPSASSFRLSPAAQKSPLCDLTGLPGRSKKGHEAVIPRLS